MSEIKQPRFSWGQKVQHRENGTPFFIRSIYWEAHGGLWLYGPEHALPHWSEKQLTEVVEPLRAEFECEWNQIVTSDGFTAVIPIISFDDLKQFIGKPTRAIVEVL